MNIAVVVSNYMDMGYNREQIECTYKETDKNESNCKM